MPATTLSLPELENLRLLLRGGSVVDWYRLRHETVADVKAFLALQGASPDDPADQARLAHLRAAAVRYLSDELGYRIPAELSACDPIELFLYASEKRGRRKDRFFACLLLKVMHIVHHIEARELRFRLPIPQALLAGLAVERTDAFATELVRDGFPLVSYSGGVKSETSLITKLLTKPEHHAATIHDRVRFRFVVEKPMDVVLLVARMTAGLFPYNYAVPGQTMNLLINFTAFMESHEAYRPLASELQLEFGTEEHALRLVNEFSGATYRTLGFVVDLPLRVPDALLATGMEGTARDPALGRVVFNLAEFQVVDRQSADENDRGENRHDRYRARQLVKVRDRLERGSRSVREDDDKSG